MADLRTKLTRAQLRALLHALPGVLAGRAGGLVSPTVGRAIQARMGVQALSLIRERFVVLARGGSYEGDRWPPLKPATIAARRKTRADISGHKRAVKAAVSSGRKPPTALAYFGSRDVEILRDTGLLLNSLSPAGPGQDSPATPEQIFGIGPGIVAVGTRRQGAVAHHYGVPGRGLPRRSLWPDRLSPRWWRLIVGQARDGLIDAIRGVV